MDDDFPEEPPLEIRPLITNGGLLDGFGRLVVRQ
jgi:hypothetical protein